MRSRRPTPEQEAAAAAFRCEIEPEQARLAYVAVTRAQHPLGLDGLSWINQHPDGNSLQHRDA